MVRNFTGKNLKKLFTFNGNVKCETYEVLRKRAEDDDDDNAYYDDDDDDGGDDDGGHGEDVDASDSDSSGGWRRNKGSKRARGAKKRKQHKWQFFEDVSAFPDPVLQDVGSDVVSFVFRHDTRDDERVATDSTSSSTDLDPKDHTDPIHDTSSLAQPTIAATATVPAATSASCSDSSSRNTTTTQTGAPDGTSITTTLRSSSGANNGSTTKRRRIADDDDLDALVNWKSSLV